LPSQVAEGLLVRIGRYISIPDIEAQLAPNNYMYTHSMTYSWDNYANEDVQTTTALTKNWFFFQLGPSIGTEAAPRHLGQTIPNPNIGNPIGLQMYPGSTVAKDPGAVPSVGDSGDRTTTLRPTETNFVTDTTQIAWAPDAVLTVLDQMPFSVS
jgi:hypothetical protein